RARAGEHRSATARPGTARGAGRGVGGGGEVGGMAGCSVAPGTAKGGEPGRERGVVPGAGRTRRLPRAVGKAKAMDMALTARMMGAEEAERAGLVSRVVPADKLMDEALEAATVIASMSLPSVMMAKECVNRAFEGSLNEGLLFERRVFHSLFATEDQKEGMAAFTEKRKPDFKHR
ncbi:enoyl-CoA hydratase, partial [Achromobacter ruhlandii]